jgi:hypothetical protein
MNTMNLDAVLTMLQSAGTDADKETVRALALRSGLAWTCEGCGWLNAITDERCFGDASGTCTGRPTVHLGSATAVHPDGDRSRIHTLAMCGADLGPMAEYKGPSGNFMRPENTAYVTVTCGPCRKAFESRR